METKAEQTYQMLKWNMNGLHQPLRNNTDIGIPNFVLKDDLKQKYAE